MKNSTPTFDDFWRAYPLHKDRKRAESAWRTMTGKDRRAALAALPAYRMDCEQHGINFKYPQGWLTGRRWEDELIQVPGAHTDDGEKHTHTDNAVDMEKW